MKTFKLNPQFEKYLVQQGIALLDQPLMSTAFVPLGFYQDITGTTVDPAKVILEQGKKWVKLQEEDFKIKGFIYSSEVRWGAGLVILQKFAAQAFIQNNSQSINFLKELLLSVGNYYCFRAALVNVLSKAQAGKIGIHVTSIEELNAKERNNIQPLIESIIKKVDINQWIISLSKDYTKGFDIFKENFIAEIMPQSVLSEVLDSAQCFVDENIKEKVIEFISGCPFGDVIFAELLADALISKMDTTFQGLISNNNSTSFGFANLMDKKSQYDFENADLSERIAPFFLGMITEFIPDFFIAHTQVQQRLAKVQSDLKTTEDLYNTLLLESNNKNSFYLPKEIINNEKKDIAENETPSIKRKRAITFGSKFSSISTPDDQEDKLGASLTRKNSLSNNNDHPTMSGVKKPDSQILKSISSPTENRTRSSTSKNSIFGNNNLKYISSSEELSSIKKISSGESFSKIPVGDLKNNTNYYASDIDLEVVTGNPEDIKLFIIDLLAEESKLSEYQCSSGMQQIAVFIARKPMEFCKLFSELYGTLSTKNPKNLVKLVNEIVTNYWQDPQFVKILYDFNRQLQSISHENKLIANLFAFKIETLCIKTIDQVLSLLSIPPRLTDEKKEHLARAVLLAPDCAIETVITYINQLLKKTVHEGTGNFLAEIIATVSSGLENNFKSQNRKDQFEQQLKSRTKLVEFYPDIKFFSENLSLNSSSSNMSWDSKKK